MAEVNTEDEEDRGAAAAQSHATGGAAGGSSVALADEGTDELPALAAIAIGVALLILAFIWPTMIADSSDDKADDSGATTEEAVEVTEALPDIPTIQGLLGEVGDIDVAAVGAGTTVVLTGVVADETTREELIGLVQVQENVAEVDATGLTVAEPEDTETEAPAEEPAVAVAGVDVTAQQVSVVLEGTVPDEATRDEIVARAVAVYSEDQVDDRIEVDPNVTPPVQIRLAGALTDGVLFGQISSAFDGIEGVEIDSSGFELAESGELEASLNSLEPIQFDSGSAIVRPESEPILDEAAALLLANPDVALEIGGHTDSLGSDTGNQSLSEARAQTVLDALRSREVANELEATGFGEQRLKVPNDENDADARSQNRRIEFRIIG